MVNEDKNIFNISSTNQQGGITAGVVNVGNQQRELTNIQKNDILNQLQTLGVRSVAIHFEYDSETKNFVQNLVYFLKNKGYVVYGDNDLRQGSGISKNEFTIIKHPSDPDFAIIRIGTQ